MADQRSTFTIEAKARGFEQVDKAASELKDTLTNAKLDASGTKAYVDGLKGATGQAQKLRQQLDEAGKAASKNVTAGFQKMAAAMKGVNAQVHAAWDTFKKFAASQKEHEKRRRAPAIPSDDQFGPVIPDDPGGGGRRRRRQRGGKDPRSEGSFTQGLLEGAMPGFRVIDRGPGAVRQAAGIGVGSLGRNLGSLPFTGGSISGALGGTFGVLASPLQRLEDQANRRVAFEQQQVGLTPYLGGFGTTAGGNQVSRALSRAGLTGAGISGRVATARERAAIEPMGAPSKADRQYADRLRQADVRRHMENIAKEGGSSLDDLSPIRRALAETQARGEIGTDNTRYMQAAQASNRTKHINDVGNAVERASKRQAASVAAQARRASLQPLMQAGKEYGGMALPQAQQFAAQMAQSGGGTAADIQKQGMLQSSFAANTALGIGAQTSGAFMQAGRVGGAGAGLGNSQFTKAIQQGMELGLRGSDLSDYMQRMASSIEEWKSTGIPLEKDSIAAMGRELEKTGIAAPRAAIAAQAGVSGLQQLGRQGAQSGEDILKMRAFGGLGKGGTDYFQAAENLENVSAKQVESGLGQYTDTAIKQGGPNIGMQARSYQKALDSLGVKVGLRESRFAVSKRQGIKLSAADEKEYAESQKRITSETQQALTGKDFMKTARGAAGGIAGAEAGRENRELMMGGSMIKANEAMKDAANNTAQAFTGLTKPITEFAEAIKMITVWIMKFTGHSGANVSQSAQ